MSPYFVFLSSKKLVFLADTIYFLTIKQCICPMLKKLLLILPLFLLHSFIGISSESFPDSILGNINSLQEHERISILNNLAGKNVSQEPQNAINMAEEALQLAIKFGDIGGKYEAYTIIGKGYLNQGLFIKALDNYELAYNISRLLGDQVKLTKALLNSGNVYRSLGKYDNALRNFIQAENISKKLKDTVLLVNSFINLGTIYQLLGNYDKALDFYYQSLNLEKKIANHHGIAQAYMNIGNVYGDLGNFELSFTFHYDALKAFMELNDTNGIVETNLNLALLYKRWQKYDESLKYLQDIKNIAVRLKNSDLLTKIYFQMGDIYFILGNIGKGEAFLKESLVLAKSGDNRPMLRSIFQSLAKLTAEKGEYKQAYLYYQNYMKINDLLSNEEMNNKITQLQLDEKDNENKILRKDNEIKRLQLDKQHSLRIAYLILLFLILAILIALYILFTIRRKYSSHLESINNNLEILVRNRTFELEKEISERKKSEQALKISQEKYRDIIEHLPIAYSEIDKNYMFRFVNKAGLELTGYTFDDFLQGVSLLELIPDKKRLISNLQKAREGQRNELEQYAMLKKDGSLVDVLIKSTPIISGNVVEAIRSTVIDITDYNVMHKALRESEEKFRELSEMLPETIYEFNEDGNFTFVNDAGLNMFEYTSQDLDNGMNIIEFISPKDHERLKISLKDILLNEQIRGIEYTGVKKNGAKFPILIYASIILKQEKPSGFRGIITDITERKQLENKLKQAQKLQSLGTLAGGIAHDFNNILMGMQLFTEISMKTIAPENPIHGNLKKILDSQFRAKELVKQILTFSSQSGDEKSPIKLDEAILDALYLITSTFPSTIKIRKEIADCGLILGNVTQIHQVLMNLCTNANHAMHGNGILTIALKLYKMSDLEKGELRTKYDECIQLTVKDNGSGMDKQTMERIFDPFFTTKKVGMGTGLGLATVFGIIKQYGGEINLTTEVGKGTTFYIYLPIYKNRLKEN